jgi:surface antigen
VIHLVSALLLPIRKLLWKPIWHFVYFFLKKPKRLFYLVGVIATFALYATYAPDTAPEVVAPDNPEASSDSVTPEVVPAYRSLVLPDIKGKISNGNARFAKRLAPSLPEKERAIYAGHFYHAVQNIPANDTYKWLKSESFFGSITVAAPFTAKNGVTCRNFDEVLAFSNKAQRFVGTACQRKSGGWCKLSRTSAHTCELGSASSMDIWWQDLF